MRLGGATIKGRTVVGLGCRHLLVASRFRPVLEHLMQADPAVERGATIASLRQVLPIQDAAVLADQLIGLRRADSRSEVAWRSWWRGFVNIPLWRPSQSLVDRLECRVLTPNRLAAWAGLCVLAVLSLAVQPFPALQPLQPGEWPALWILVTFTTLFHELGHFFVAAHYGVRSRSIGIALFYIQPAGYTDVSNSWLVGRGARIAIALGGMLFQSLLLLPAYAAWRITGAPLLGWYCAASLGWMAFNLLPFVRLDGYWVLSFALDEHNLRQRAFGQLFHALMPARVPASWSGPEGVLALLFAALSAVFTVGLYASAVAGVQLVAPAPVSPYVPFAAGTAAAATLAVAWVRNRVRPRRAGSR
jgi:hypothetical protein